MQSPANVYAQQYPNMNVSQTLTIGKDQSQIFHSPQQKSQKSLFPPSIPVLGIDFSFNTIKDVKKVNWKEEAPWFREISDGFCWLCYCMNENCKAYKELVVINRGYRMLNIRDELSKIVCPCCKTGNKKGPNGQEPTLVIRNCGFVNCQWAMKGILIKNKDSKIYSEGRTYDSKLYTLKETNYRGLWHSLDICVKQL